MAKFAPPVSGVLLEKLDSFPVGSNPFNHDLYHMGQRLGKNLIVMFKNHPDEDCPYLILVNPTTGERYKLSFEEK